MLFVIVARLHPPIPSLPRATSFLSFLAFLISVRQVEALPIFVRKGMTELEPRSTVF
jgi:hypothetical protein